MRLSTTRTKKSQVFQLSGGRMPGSTTRRGIRGSSASPVDVTDTAGVRGVLRGNTRERFTLKRCAGGMGIKKKRI